MGHGVSFGSELALNHRAIRAAAAGGAADGLLAATLARHVRLLRDHVLPALVDGVADGAELAATDSLLLDSIDDELRAYEPLRPGARERGAAVLLELMEAQLAWELDALLPLMEAETTWIVLEDLAEKTQAARIGW